jgi:DNA-binding GntR family transcriptional regulator
MTAPAGILVLEGRPTAELIADQLRELIVQGAFRPGQQINESALAGQLNTSRGPLREALQRLCQEGILVSKRNRGVFVLELTTEDIREIYAVREAVELSAANTLVDAGQDRITEICTELQGIIDDMERYVATSDWQAIARLDMQFHTCFVSGTGNTRLIRIYETLAAETRMCMLSLEVAYPRISALAQEHQEILDQLREGDRRGLRNVIKRHMRKAVHDLSSSPSRTVTSA